MSSCHDWNDKQGSPSRHLCTVGAAVGDVQHKFSSALSLVDMLEDSCSSDEDEGGITAEVIERFRLNQKLLESQRNELRRQLRQNFELMTQRCTCINTAGDSARSSVRACICRQHPLE
jgi:hypothetical protein